MQRRLFSLVTLCLLGLGTESATAADWAKQLFPVKTHDFGSVAVASKTEFKFPIRNQTKQDVHISNVRASCGCTTPILEQQWIKAGQEAELTARFNTGSFRGKKGATLTVVIDRPAYAEVQLRVDGYIRQDMVFNPGAVDFGQVDAGDGAESSISVAYAGRSDWQILGVESPNPHLTCEIQEKARGGQRVNYVLAVKLSPAAEEGFLREDLILKTNDRSMPRVPLAVTGTITAPLTVAPQAITVNELKPGESVRQRLVVRGQSPFKVTEIECEGFEVKFDAPKEAAKAHVLSLELVAQAAPGPVKSSLIIRTDSENGMTAQSIVTGTILDR